MSTKVTYLVEYKVGDERTYRMSTPSLGFSEREWAEKFAKTCLQTESKISKVRIVEETRKVLKVYQNVGTMRLT